MRFSRLKMCERSHVIISLPNMQSLVLTKEFLAETATLSTVTISDVLRLQETLIFINVVFGIHESQITRVY